MITNPACLDKKRRQKDRQTDPTSVGTCLQEREKESEYAYATKLTFKKTTAKKWICEKTLVRIPQTNQENPPPLSPQGHAVYNKSLS